MALAEINGLKKSFVAPERSRSLVRAQSIKAFTVASKLATSDTL